MIRNIAIVMLLTASLTASAQYRHIGRYRYHWYGPRFTTVVTRPVVVSHTSNRFSTKDRLAMAIAYIKENNSLTASKYSKLTKLDCATAEAELDAFAANKNNPIAMVKNGKKKMYVLQPR